MIDEKCKEIKKEKTEKNYNPLEVNFALKKLKQGKLTVNQLTRLANQSGDPAKFYEDLNKATNFSIPSVIKKYEQTHGLSKGDFEARRELEKFGVRTIEDEKRRGKGEIIPPHLPKGKIIEVARNKEKLPTKEVIWEMNNYKGSKKKLDELNESIVKSLTMQSLYENEGLRTELYNDLKKAKKKISWEEAVETIAVADKPKNQKTAKKIKENKKKWSEIAKKIREIVIFYDYRQRKSTENRKIKMEKKGHRKR